MAGNIYKLQTNIPVSGTLRAAYFAPTKNPGQMPDQIKVQGNFDGAVGQATIYLPIAAAPTFAALGLIVPTGAMDRDGLPAYRVSNAHFCMTKVDRGPMKVELTGGGGPPQQAPQQQHAPQQQAQQQPQNAPGPQQNAQQGQEPPAVTAARLIATMELAWTEARRIITKTMGIKDGEILTPQDVHPTAASLFIAFERRNALKSAPKDDQQKAAPLASVAAKQEINKLTNAIGLNIEDFLRTELQVSDISRLTESQAVLATNKLRAEIFRREEARRLADAQREMPQADMRGDAYEDAQTGGGIDDF